MMNGDLSGLVERLEKLRLQPGDTLAVILNSDAPSYPLLRLMSNAFSGITRMGVHVCILAKGTKLVKAEAIAIGPDGSTVTVAQDGVDYANLLRKYIAHVAQISETDWLPVTEGHGEGFTDGEIAELNRLAGRNPDTGEMSE